MCKNQSVGWWCSQNEFKRKGRQSIGVTRQNLQSRLGLFKCWWWPCLWACFQAIVPPFLAKHKMQHAPQRRLHFSMVETGPHEPCRESHGLAFSGGIKHQWWPLWGGEKLFGLKVLGHTLFFVKEAFVFTSFTIFCRENDHHPKWKPPIFKEKWRPNFDGQGLHSICHSDFNQF